MRYPSPFRIVFSVNYQQDNFYYFFFAMSLKDFINFSQGGSLFKMCSTWILLLISTFLFTPFMMIMSWIPNAIVFGCLISFGMFFAGFMIGKYPSLKCTTALSTALFPSCSEIKFLISIIFGGTNIYVTEAKKKPGTS